MVSKAESRTESEGYHLALTYKALGHEETTVKRFLGLLHGLQKRRDWATIKHHLSRRHPLVYTQFSHIDADGFAMVGEAPFDIWTSDTSPPPPQHPQSIDPPSKSIVQVLAQARRDVHSVSLLDRQRLVGFWAEEIRGDATDGLFESVKEADLLHQQLSNIHDDVDRRVLQTADVIGVTTSGLAGRIATLRRVRCKVVICEEAGEVLEPHILSALLPGVEHFIQIGDHQQLRPQINNYKLSL